MDRVIYKHRLKSGRNEEDFRAWLRMYWNVQRSWGAETVRVWRDAVTGENILFCEYRVADVRIWTKAAMRASSEAIIRDLEAITEIKNVMFTREKNPEAMLQGVN